MKKFIPSIVSGVFFIVVSFVLSFGAKFLFYHSMDYDYWFYYDSVKPVKTEFMIGEELKFESNSVFYRNSHVIWNDILRCKNEADEQFSFYSNYTSENINVIGVGADKTPSSKQWFYQAVIPNKLSICYLTSVIQVQLPLGLTKTQQITGPEFVISSH